MADRLRPFDDVALEAALRDLGGALAVPAVGAAGGLDPAARARLRITQATGAANVPRRRWSWLAPTPGRRLSRGAVFALVALLSLAAVAGAIGLGLPGIRIVFAPPASPIPSLTGSTGPSPSLTPTARPTPTPRPTPADPLGSNLGMGSRIQLATAPDLVDIPVTLPTAPGVGTPATVWLLEGRLSFVWSATPTLPELAEPGVGLILSEFRGSLDSGYFQKIISQGTTITTVSVDGEPAYWISGTAHEIVYVGADGQAAFDSRRSVGDTLLWTRDDVTYRLESGLDRAATIAIAASIR